MKILCDVCDKGEASVFCVADEASLCAACDHRVHHANKLAGKHQRFSLHHPTSKQAPICDICQERRAFLFCQQDRAILCRECDIPIHKANEHTQKHARFLLTGVKLSATSALYSESQSAASSNNAYDAVSNVPPAVVAQEDKIGNMNNVSMSTSSISEYLMEMLPGWHFEDFLDSSSYHQNENELIPLWDNIDKNNMGFWVPQAPPPPPPTQNQSIDLASFHGYGEEMMIKSSRKRVEDNSFAVPQINPPSFALKRSRNVW